MSRWAFLLRQINYRLSPVQIALAIAVAVVLAMTVAARQ